MCAADDVIMCVGRLVAVRKVLLPASMFDGVVIEYVTCLHNWTLFSRSERSSEWQCIKDLCIMMTDAISFTLVWSESGGIATVLHPEMIR